MKARAFLVIPLVATALGMIGCDKPAKEREATSPPVQVSKDEPNGELTKATQTNAATTGDAPVPIVPIEELSAIIRHTRPVRSEEVVMALVQLQKQWSPVGKSVDDVKATIGTPGKEDAQELAYFVAVEGLSWCEWKMSVETGTVKNAKFEILTE